MYLGLIILPLAFLEKGDKGIRVRARVRVRLRMVRIRIRLRLEGGASGLSYSHTNAVGVVVMHEGGQVDSAIAPLMLEGLWLCMRGGKWTQL